MSPRENGCAEREVAAFARCDGGGIVADTLDDGDAERDRGGEPCEQIVGDRIATTMSRRGAMHGLAAVQSRAEAERAHDKLEVGVGEDENGVFAGEFHHGRECSSRRAWRGRRGRFRTSR